MLNVSSEEEGIGGAVLLRAVEPLQGIRQMERSRGVTDTRNLTRGPGRLAAAFSIDKRLDGVDMCDRASPLWLGTETQPIGVLGITTRIGLSREMHRQLRFFERDNRFVSGPAAPLKS